jgi:23S rRNA (adenine2503-C2)-methyltransferase
MSDCKAYFRETNRRVSFEYALLGTKNFQHILVPPPYIKVNEILIMYLPLSWHYVWAAGINDSVENAVELAKLLREYGSGYHVNLIPFNPIEGSEFRRPYRKAVWYFSYVSFILNTIYFMAWFIR